MAAIDKIYIKNYDQYLEFKNWCKQQPSFTDKYGNVCTLMDFLWKKDESFKGGPIMNNPYYVDAILIRTCPFDYIQEELMLSYGHWSQKHIREYYEKVINWDISKGECPFWAKPEDFITLENGTMTIKGLEESDYERIKKGELFNSPKIDYEYGKHFKCVKHPHIKVNRAFKCKCFWVSVKVPESFMVWYSRKFNTWHLSQEFVFSGDTSSHCVRYKTIKAIKRMILKWKLPIGAKVTVEGRYFYDTYEFVITK